METIILTKEQAQALELLKEDIQVGSDKLDYVVTHHVSHVWEAKKRKALNELDLNTLLEAYYKGYKVEESPEECVVNLYNDYKNMVKMAGKYDDLPYQEAMEAIKKTLNILKVKIKGIND